jgi:hypothetical protein
MLQVTLPKSVRRIPCPLILCVVEKATLLHEVQQYNVISVGEWWNVFFDDMLCDVLHAQFEVHLIDELAFRGLLVLSLALAFRRVVVLGCNVHFAEISAKCPFSTQPAR